MQNYKNAAEISSKSSQILWIVKFFLFTTNLLMIDNSDDSGMHRDF